MNTYIHTHSRTHACILLRRSRICGSHIGDYEALCLLGYNDMQSVDFQRTTRRYISEDTTLHSHFSLDEDFGAKTARHRPDLCVK
jgi:hypothetical protein